MSNLKEKKMTNTAQENLGIIEAAKKNTVYSDTSQNEYWKSYYEKKPFFEPSTFCKFICDRYMLSGKNVVDFCCGNGRDTEFLSGFCNKILGVDRASENKSHDNVSYLKIDVSDFIDQSAVSEFDASYCRFGIHSVPEPIEDKILDFSQTIFFEFRSDRDSSFVPDHYRRLINGNSFVSKMISKGYKLFYFVESSGLAIYKKQDPIIIRVVGSKVLNKT